MWNLNRTPCAQPATPRPTRRVCPSCRAWSTTTKSPRGRWTTPSASPRECTQSPTSGPHAIRPGQADADCPPMGARSGSTPSSRCRRSVPRLLPDRAPTMKTYGLILADNGSNWYFQGTADRAGPTPRSTSSSRSRPARSSRSTSRAYGDPELRPGPPARHRRLRAALRRAAALGRYSPRARAGLAQVSSTRKLSRAQASAQRRRARASAGAPKVVGDPDVVDQTRRAMLLPDPPLR